MIRAWLRSRVRWQILLANGADPWVCGEQIARCERMARLHGWVQS